MPVTIRPIRATDRSAWGRLWSDYLTFYESGLGDKGADSIFERLLRPDPQDFRGLVAELDGRIVGFTHYLFHQHNWRIENVCYLQDLYAEPHARGKGIGKALIDAVHEDADQEGSSGVYWLTQQPNLTAQQLYDRIATKTDFIKDHRPAA